MSEELCNCDGAWTQSEMPQSQLSKLGVTVLREVVARFFARCSRHWSTDGRPTRPCQEHEKATSISCQERSKLEAQAEAACKLLTDTADMLEI